MFGKYIAILAYPAQPAAHRPASFQHRCAVYEASAGDFTYIFFNIEKQLLQFIFYYIVVIGAICILGDLWCL